MIIFNASCKAANRFRSQQVIFFHFVSKVWDWNLQACSTDLWQWVWRPRSKTLGMTCEDIKCHGVFSNQRWKLQFLYTHVYTHINIYICTYVTDINVARCIYLYTHTHIHKKFCLRTPLATHSHIFSCCIFYLCARPHCFQARNKSLNRSGSLT